MKIKNLSILLALFTAILLLSFCGTNEKFDMSNFDKTIVGKWNIETKIYKGNNIQDLKEIDNESYETLKGEATLNEDKTYTFKVNGKNGNYSAEGKYTIEATSVTFKPEVEKFNDKNIEKTKEVVYAFVPEGDKLKSTSTDDNNLDIYTYWSKK